MLNNKQMNRDEYSFDLNGNIIEKNLKLWNALKFDKRLSSIDLPTNIEVIIELLAPQVPHPNHFYIKLLKIRVNQLMTTDHIAKKNISNSQEPLKLSISLEDQNSQSSTHPKTNTILPGKMYNPITQHNTQLHPHKLTNPSEKSIITNHHHLKSSKTAEGKIESQEIKTVPLVIKQTILGSLLNKVKEQRCIQGFLGHSTVIFKRPIIEGKYYVQFKILHPPSISSTKDLNEKAAWRIGICPANYSINCPLGKRNSIGLKLKTGDLITNSKIIQSFGSTGEVGDVFGLLINFSPPYKHLNKNQIWEGSWIEIRKNNELVCRYDQILQDYYCPGLSLFNYGRTEVRINREQMEYLPNGYKGYGQIFMEEIMYEDLQNSSIFREFWKNKK